MADRPIIFSGPMVRALLDGRKTQTRRVLREDERPRYAVGDRLWVKEEWSGHYHFRDTPPAKRVSVMTPDGPILREDIWYWADGRPATGDYERPRPPLFMPRWASRITLIVESVRVERLQDISEEDAIAEGMTQETADAFMCPEELAVFASAHILCPDSMARIVFETYWDRMHGQGAWARNPLVAACTFRPVLANIDTPEAGA